MEALLATRRALEAGCSDGGRVIACTQPRRLAVQVSDSDYINRLVLCLYIALPFFVRRVSSSKLLTCLDKLIIPAFDQLPEDRKLNLLKALEEISPCTLPQDSRQILLVMTR
ncbi:apoptosis inhibitor 5-like protein API5 isoform X3 [Mercurialis annua]|uniref:apoptosis inhibitor 5-like protein API5 isoform X3 n=1 Tax=Mercurialis annua TaxID=3986 RepID=UPI0024AE84E6|nr:apoptosis inhibitor 5-like protein API5 isoform X3 [Mercurialis annua]